MIPNKFHYVWIGPYEDNRTFVYEWTTVMPEHSLIKWDNPIVYLEEAIALFGGIDNLKHSTYAYVSDLVRLLVLRDHGGIYMDHDIKLLRDLSTLLEDKTLALTFQYDTANKEHANTWNIGDSLATFDPTMWSGARYNTDTVNNCFIAATAGHPVVQRMIDLTVENHFKPKHEQFAMSDWGAGPAVASAACKEFGLDITDSVTVEKDGMVVFERQLMHPVHGTERARIGSDAYYKQIDDLIQSETCYAIHMHDNCGTDLYMTKQLVFFDDWYKENVLSHR